MINNPNLRLGKNGVLEIKNHPFFNDIDWDNLLNMIPILYQLYQVIMM